MKNTIDKKRLNLNEYVLFNGDYSTFAGMIWGDDSEDGESDDDGLVVD